MADQQKAHAHGLEQEKTTPLADTGKAALINPVADITEETSKEAAETSVRTHLGKMTLSMFEKGQFVYVRVGAAHNATELYEHAYDSADEANAALLDADILAEDAIADPSKVVGTGIELSDVTAEQLERAGLKRHLSSSL